MNPHKGESILKVGDREYKIKFTTNCMCLMEDELGIPIIQIYKNMGMRECRVLVWGGLKHYQPDTTLERAGEILDQVGNEECMGKVAEAFINAFPEASAKKNKEAKVGTGASS